MKAVWVALGAAGVVALGLAVARYAPEPAPTAEQLRAFGYTAYPNPRPIPDFDLADAAGGRFTPARLQGRWSLLFFGYANCPDICPVTMSELGNAAGRMEAAGEDVFQGVLVSVDPERDTAEALAAYVAAFRDDFVGVTGDMADIRAFAGSLHAGFAKAAAADSALGYLVDHSSQLAVIQPDGRHAGFVRGPFDAARLRSLIDALRQRWQDR